METPDQTGNNAAITDLRDRWDQLQDLDRAVAVHNIHKAGTSFRALAKALNRSESLLRHLNRAAQAPLPDRILARKGEITTRELARRGRAAQARESHRVQQALERERNRKSEEVSKAIGDFLDRKQWSPQFGEPLVDEARRYLAFAEAAQLVPSKPFPPVCLPLVEVLERLWPPSTGDAGEDTALCAESLVKFVVATLPDSRSRHRALSLALNQQIRR